MKCVRIRLGVLAGLLSVAACSSDVPISGSEWRVESLGASTRPFADGNARVAFDEKGRISASAGCNRMGGEYTVNGNELAISRVMSTRMACFPEQKMLDEQALAEALSKATRLTIAQDKAMLSSADGVVLVLWRVK